MITNLVEFQFEFVIPVYAVKEFFERYHILCFDDVSWQAVQLFYDSLRIKVLSHIQSAFFQHYFVLMVYTLAQGFIVDQFEGGGSLGFYGERKRAILGAEINHGFCEIRTVYLFRTLADS